MLSKRPSFIKFLQIVLIFLYLELLLLSTLLRPCVDIDVRWLPKSFFSSRKQTTCIIRMHYSVTALLEATFFTTIAMFGYFCGCGAVAGVGRGIYECTLAKFEQSMMGIRLKMYWICFVPWIITFAQNWLHNLGEYLLMFSQAEMYEAHNVYLAMFLLFAFFMVQAALASEIVYMALHGWSAMKNINEENIEWKKMKRQFSGDTLDTVFGLVD